MSQRRGGIISVNINGELQDAKGDFTYNLGQPKRETIIGSNGKPQGYKEAGQEPFIEGTITDRGDMDLEALVKLKDATVTLELANGKVIVLRNAWYAGEGTGNTGEGEIPLRLAGMSAEEIR